MRSPARALRPPALLALAALAPLGACGGDGASPVDGGVFAVDGGPPSFELGIGMETFEPITASTTVPLVRGPQAGGRFDGFHVEMAVRLRSLRRTDAERLELVVRAEDGTPQSMVALVPRGAAFLGVDGRELVRADIRARLADCCALESAPIRLEGRLTLADGRVLEDAHEARAGRCLDEAGSPCP